ncbi:sensor histidine kinase [Roseovarius aestuarii]|uniref:histidine kinase n=1 Tax=Roseovarius aestuarii TaxID=475083 RepID=A0A1X7BRS9_9RHOB|nr:HAMP domain-containing sensor histidine kinase [Roseovarius aestuarii]SMC11909.1 Phytochrome-like protein cph1 [Roseovarius aestuarii]
MGIQQVEGHAGKTSAPGQNHAGSKEFEDFIYLLSHDIRNSVRALLEVPQWIQDDLIEAGYRINEPLQENLALMNTHTRRLDRMLIDLLVYSRAGRMQVVKMVDISESIAIVLDQLTIPAGFEIDLNLKCEEIRMGDRDVLTLFSALVSNAVKHHDLREGKLEITTLKKSGDCVIVVSDDGPGIPEKYRERVFEVMTTLKPRDEVEGSGMGLACVRKIVEIYGGQVAWLSDPAQRGTSIELRFPI